ncbi:MAG: HPF/RaiA family ribosome-associated protein [Cyclobacteriaceae bacterium]|nr:HPF/RaiA family ribosome-associated protein [Cyclobacteriaceae bacterium]MBL7833993.1 HPF/RaiA family ribosome-associated protein [Cyclobacteriaceae bacterium]
MLVEVNTDRNIPNSERLINYCKSTIEAELARFDEYITRVEVHLSDENGAKGGDDDKRCLIETKLKGKSPVAVKNTASNIDDAISGAIDKITKVLETSLDKMRNH